MTSDLDFLGSLGDFCICIFRPWWPQWRLRPQAREVPSSGVGVGVKKLGFSGKVLSLSLGRALRSALGTRDGALLVCWGGLPRFRSQIG